MARTQQRMRIEQLEDRALEELGLDAGGLVADYGPDQAVPATMVGEDGELPDPVPFVREEQAPELAAEGAFEARHSPRAVPRGPGDAGRLTGRAISCPVAGAR